MDNKNSPVNLVENIHLIIGAVSTHETSENICQITRHNILDDSHLQDAIYLPNTKYLGVELKDLMLLVTIINII